MFANNPFFQSISNWFRRNFSDPNAISLFMTIVLGILFLEFFGKLLMPIIVSVIVAYLLYTPVRLLERWRFPHLAAVLVVYLLFIGLFVLAIVGLLPLLWKESLNLANELPQAFTKSQGWFNELMRHYPKVFSEIQLQHVISFFREQSVQIGKVVLQYSLATIPGLIQVVLYFILVPILVFFFLKDSDIILQWFGYYMPSNRSLVNNVWSEVNFKIGAYVRGRVLEIIVVGIVTTIAFEILGLQYTVLLGALVGLSVIIPYIGAVIVTIPVVIIALMQWGVSAHFTYLIVVYALIIILDANVLVPLLFAETMDLHPVTIILAVVIFGAIWGFWGVFFAIPLATLVNAVLKAWPRGGTLESG